MNKLFDYAYLFMRENEGGYSDHEKDPGGETLYGVSRKYWPKVYEDVERCKDDVGEVENILREFYRQEFWNPLYPVIKPAKLAVRLFDLSVNLSKRTAVRLLQETVNFLGTERISEDGVFGQQTLTAINHLSIYNDDIVYKVYCEKVRSYYRSRNNYKYFGRGWENRLNKEIKI